MGNAAGKPNIAAVYIEQNDDWELRKARVAEFLQKVKAYEKESPIPAALPGRMFWTTMSD